LLLVYTQARGVVHGTEERGEDCTQYPVQCGRHIRKSLPGRPGLCIGVSSGVQERKSVGHVHIIVNVGLQARSGNPAMLNRTSSLTPQ
jgi:hypothetical protein